MIGNPSPPPYVMSFGVDGGTFRLRPAVPSDLPAIVALLADDAMGAGRQSREDPAPYERAFAAIDADPCHLLIVGEFVPAGAAVELVVVTFQLTFLPGLSRQGAWRSQIEGVRVARSVRGKGLGKLVVRWAIDESRRRGCTLMQLTTHKARVDAHRFYRRLGFEASHQGMKLQL